MYSRTIAFALLALLFNAVDFGGTNPVPDSEHQRNVRAAPTLQFEGCFSDSAHSIFNTAVKFQSSNNVNHDCVDKCAERGYAVSSTRGQYCYCTNTLPLPRLYQAGQPQASGTDGPCSTTCPGASIAGGNTGCQGEECCGGPNAYSVYLSGEIDVLKQVLRRVTAAKRARDPRTASDVCGPVPTAGLGILGAAIIAVQVAVHEVCKSVVNYQVSAYGRSVNSQGVQGIKNCTLTTFLQSNNEIYNCEDLASLPDQHIQLAVLGIDKLIQSEEPIQEELATDFDIVNDNLHGTTDQTLIKSYSVSTSFSESWSTEAGVDVTVTVGAEFSAGALFTRAKTTFELSVGISFSFGWSKTTGRAVTETFSVRTVAEPGTKVETRFFKSQYPVQVNWRANIFASGYIHAKDYGETTMQEMNLVEVLSHDQRGFFAFGTIDYGDRKTMIARSVTKDANGQVMSMSEDSRGVE